jgi:hypothetical protein
LQEYFHVADVYFSKRNETCDDGNFEEREQSRMRERHLFVERPQNFSSTLVLFPVWFQFFYTVIDMSIVKIQKISNGPVSQCKVVANSVKEFVAVATCFMTGIGIHWAKDIQQVSAPKDNFSDRAHLAWHDCFVAPFQRRNHARIVPGDHEPGKLADRYIICCGVTKHARNGGRWINRGNILRYAIERIGRIFMHWETWQDEKQGYDCDRHQGSDETGLKIGRVTT